MKIYIDVSVLTLATFVTGIQRATKEIAVRLIEGKNDIVLLYYNAKDNCYHQIDNTKFIEFYLNGRGVKEKMITKRQVPLAEIGQGNIFFDLDAAWMCRVKRSYLLPIIKEQGSRIVAHIYDIISITHPQYCMQRGVYHFMDYIGAHLQYADEIIVNARATENALRELAAQLNISLPLCQVVPLGANFNVQEKTVEKSPVENANLSEDNISNLKVPQNVIAAAKRAPYILMVGTIEPRKNHKLLLEAYDIGLKKLGFQIILAGNMGWDMKEFEQKLLQHPDYNKGIYYFSGLDDKAIDYLYQHAKFLAFCSYTEGFGLPIIESIVRGTPVIAADVPILREVTGAASGSREERYIADIGEGISRTIPEEQEMPEDAGCVWFPQDDAEALCREVEYYHNHDDAYQALKEKMDSYHAVTWEESYEEMKKVLEK